jgi:hypothetical protein
MPFVPRKERKKYHLSQEMANTNFLGLRLHRISSITGNYRKCEIPLFPSEASSVANTKLAKAMSQ